MFTKETKLKKKIKRLTDGEYFLITRMWRAGFMLKEIKRCLPDRSIPQLQSYLQTLKKHNKVRDKITRWTREEFQKLFEFFEPRKFQFLKKEDWKELAKLIPTRKKSALQAMLNKMRTLDRQCTKSRIPFTLEMMSVELTKQKNIKSEEGAETND